MVRSFEVVAAYVLQVCNSVSPFQENNYSPQVTVFDVPSHWTDILGTGAIISAVLGESQIETLNAKIALRKILMLKVWGWKIM